jgi:hypothetical protein
MRADRRRVFSRAIVPEIGDGRSTSPVNPDRPASFLRGM